ncbi:MAG TPA: glycosyltransferase family 2 protein [Thermoanaerobaculia bacterium]|jgi:dolichol-phosphate mannosyltransferase/undecaprenyl-phosphate 4-deoxy-4-formamido-L-arabinose transferase
MLEPATAAKESARRRLVSIVIPVYNSPALAELVERIAAVFRGRDDDYEIVFVDDSSPDARIWTELEMLAQRDSRIRAIQLTRNFGQQAATLCGLRESRGDVIVTMDDDLQHDPADIPLLLAEAAHDVVIGELRQQEVRWSRRLASRLKARFEEILIDKPKRLQLSSFRVLRRVIADSIVAMQSPHPFLPALLFYVTRDVAGVPVSHGRRFAGESGYTMRKLLRLFSNLIISNSSILLRTAALSGIAFAVLSFAVAAWVTYQKLANGIAVQGWSSLFAAILLMGGMVLFSVGVIGEYLIRIIESSEARPTYFVRRRAFSTHARYGETARAERDALAARDASELRREESLDGAAHRR